MAKRVRKPKLKRKPKPYTTEDGVTQSLLSTWVNCRRAAAHYLSGLRPEQLKESLAYGSLWHKLLEGLYRGVQAGTIVRANAGDYFEATVKAWLASRRKWTSCMELGKAELLVAKSRL